MIYTWPTQTPFSCDERNLRTQYSRGRVCKLGELIHRNSERPVHSFPENQILTFLWRIGNQERAGTAADYFASSVVSTGRHRVALVGAKFTTRGTKAEIIPGRNAKWNTKFPEFPNFQKKGQPREADQNFQNEFPKTFCSIRFWTGNSGNFGRMELARGIYP